jgi:hypothetical protein
MVMIIISFINFVLILFRNNRLSEFEKVELNNQAIIAFIKASGKMNVNIDGME